MLREIREDAQTLAKVVADTMDVDVLIVDDRQNIIAATCHYGSIEGGLPSDAFVHRVVRENRVIIERERDRCGPCAQCSRREACRTAGLVGVPVYLDGRIMGAAAILVPQHRQAAIFEQGRNPVAFLTSMADLLEGKLQNARALRQLTAVQRERENLMDSLRDAYVSTDSAGFITYYNRRFTELFRPEEPILNRLFYQVLPHPQLEELVREPRSLRNHLMFHRVDGQDFYGFLTCTQLYAGTVRTGATFRFRLLDDARSAFMTPVEYQEGVNLGWAGDNMFFTEAIIDRAKRLAVTDRNILITGEEGTGKRMLARCIHNYSDRNAHPLVAVDCFRSYRDHLPRSIFGMLGKLQSAHQSTMVFHDIEKLPLSLQLELVDFLRQPTLHFHDGPGIAVDVRFIFISSCDLGAMTRNGLFSDELYYRICEHHLALTPLREDPARLARHILSTMAYYARAHGRPGMTLAPELLDRLCQYSWPGNLWEIESMCDAAAFSGSDGIFSALLAGGDDGAQEGQTISQLERQMIADMLGRGQSKEKVAQALGISRATLYRRLKAYGL